MRTRAIVALVLLALPVELSAQRLRLPGIGGRRPRPAELPPQAPTIARELAYRRLPLAVESYPLISRVESSGFMGNGVSSSWTSLGAGTRADYRIKPQLSATLDLTSSFAGGPVIMETAEIGARLRPERAERLEGRLYPFVDLRFGYAYAYHTYFLPIGDIFGSMPPQSAAYGTRYSQGFGGVGGVGAEYVLSPRFSLTSGASLMRTRMTAYGYQGNRPTNDKYRMTSYRYTLGIRYNPVRWIAQPPSR